jgi:hypothetical protein
VVGLLLEPQAASATASNTAGISRFVDMRVLLQQGCGLTA